MSAPVITVDEVLRLLWEAASYPCIGNEDWRVAARMEAAALAKVESAVASPDDPPEFALWLRGLKPPDVSLNDPQCAQPWGDGSAGTSSYYNPEPPVGRDVVIEIFGLMPQGQGASAGVVYHSTVIVLARF